MAIMRHSALLLVLRKPYFVSLQPVLWSTKVIECDERTGAKALTFNKTVTTLGPDCWIFRILRRMEVQTLVPFLCDGKY